MASYTMANIKLGLTLEETGRKGDDRINVYLTNSLEEPHDNLGTLFSQQLAKESEQASKVKKEQPIMVVMGNPPYSGISSNNGERITKMIEDYKYIDGVHFGERKHRLQDDYVKFIRFAESFVEKNGEGIVAYINNHGFLDNPTFRGMRWHLLQTFDSIYIVDLHGNSKKKEVTPDGSVDQNVFDIQAGVSIQFFVKTGKQRK
jgi:predicted helicase